MPGVVTEAVTRRDVRVDLLRGFAIIFVVVNHIDQRSLWHVVTVERLGLFTGAEVFVLLSGVVLGMVHGRRSVTAGWADSARTLLRRARTLYLTTIAVIVAVLLLRVVPGIDDSSLATYTDGKTGTAYDLYPESSEPGGFLRGVVLLIYGPGEFNIMGLYVVLLAVAPLALYLLVTNKWHVLLALSAAGYLAAHLGADRLLPSQFENSFSLLAWQLLFFGGMIVGFHRGRIATWVSVSTRKQWLVATAAAASLALAVLAWCNPCGLAPGAHLPLISSDQFGEIYFDFFDRRVLGIGRLVNVAVACITAYALLSWWPGVAQTRVAQYVASLGHATLYVFVVHLAFVLLVDNVTQGRQRGLVFGTVIQAVVIAALVFMVRKRVLFRVIPR